TRPYKDTFAQAKRETFRLQGLDVQRGIGAGDGKADGVRTGIDGRDMDRLGHRLAYRQRWGRGAEGLDFVERIPSCSAMRWRSCLFTVETLASPSSSMKLCFLAITSNSRLIIVW